MLCQLILSSNYPSLQITQKLLTFARTSINTLLLSLTERDNNEERVKGEEKNDSLSEIRQKALYKNMHIN